MRYDIYIYVIRRLKVKSHGNFLKNSDQPIELSKQPMETSGQTVVLFVLNYAQGIKFSRIGSQTLFEG